jgi:hypothetical protein
MQAIVVEGEFIYAAGSFSRAGGASGVASLGLARSNLICKEK